MPYPHYVKETNTPFPHNSQLFTSIFIQNGHENYQRHIVLIYKPEKIINLESFVSVPPQKIVITNESGAQLESVVGPFPEGASFTLRCDVFGGKHLSQKILKFQGFWPQNRFSYVVMTAL